MNSFIKKVLFVCLILYSAFVFAENDCRKAFSPLTQYEPYEIGARPSDLKIQIAEIEAQVKKRETDTLYTSDRLAILYARAWVEAAKKFASEREEGDLPNRTGGTFIGVSRFGESALRETEDLKPFGFKLMPSSSVKIDITKLERGKTISEETVTEMVRVFQNQGSEGLRRFVINSTKPLSDNEISSIAEGAEQVLLASAKLALRDLGYVAEVREAVRDSRREIIEAFRSSENEIRADFEKLEQQILNNPEFRVREAEDGSIEQILLSELGIFNPSEAFKPPRDGEQVSVEFYRVLKEFREATKFRDSFEKIEGRTPTFLEELIELLNDASYRRQLRSAALEKLYRQENDFITTLGRQGSKLPEVDILFIGAGLHEQNMQNYLRLNAKTLKTLTIERADIPGSTFAVGGKAFNLNSSSKAEDTTSLRQRLGESDLNFLPGGVAQVNQFSREKNPPAEYFADAIIINRGFSDNPILFNREVINVEKRGEQYLVTLSDGIQIIAKSIVQTGIGKPSIPKFIKGLREVYEQNSNESDPNQPKQVLTYPEFMKFVNGTTKPLTPFSNKKVAVIGAGDSGKAIVRWLSIQSNPDSYGRDTRRVSQPERIFWYGQECNTCAEFVNENRSFYADLVGGFKSGRTIAKNKLASVERTEDGRFLLKTAEGSSDIGDKITGETVDYIDGRVLLKTSDGSPTARRVDEVVDYIIVTTGFENPIEALYGNVMGSASTSTNNLSPAQFIEQSPNLRIIQGVEPSLGVVGIARQVVNRDGSPEDIYLVGPLAGRIVDPRELKDIEENFVANANHNWRAWRLIEALAVRLLKPLD